MYLSGFSYSNTIFLTYPRTLQYRLMVDRRHITFQSFRRRRYRPISSRARIHNRLHSCRCKISKRRAHREPHGIRAIVIRLNSVFNRQRSSARRQICHLWHRRRVVKILHIRTSAFGIRLRRRLFRETRDRMVNR